MVKITAACGCHMGRVRGNNEDNLYFDGLVLPEDNTGLEETALLSLPLDRPVSLAIFDGMGGQACGETAARLAAEETKAVLGKEPLADLEWTCRCANQRVCDEAAQRKASMGATVVMLRFLDEEIAEMLNVGDSKAFLLRDGGLRQLSADHSDAALLEELGITDRTPRLTQHLGIEPREMMIEPCFVKVELLPGDRFLLCSDGLTDMVPVPEITLVLNKPGTVGDAAEELIGLALEKGGKDNITVIVCEILRETPEGARRVTDDL